jgi:hypothetical protein
MEGQIQGHLWQKNHTILLVALGTKPKSLALEKGMHIEIARKVPLSR